MKNQIKFVRMFLLQFLNTWLAPFITAQDDSCREMHKDKNVCKIIHFRDNKVFPIYIYVANNSINLPFSLPFYCSR